MVRSIITQLILGELDQEYSGWSADLGVFASAGLDRPYAIAVDHAADLLVANTQDNTIPRYSATGDDLGTHASTGLNLPDGLAFEPMEQATPEPGMLAMAAAAAGRVRKRKQTIKA